MSKAISDEVLATLCIYAEARGEPFLGQIAIGNVIRNRMSRKYSSDGTVAGTVLKPLQFSWTNTFDTQRIRVFQADTDSKAYKEALTAWRLSQTESPAGSAVLYHADYVSPPWTAKAKFIKKIGRHLFYDDKL